MAYEKIIEGARHCFIEHDCRDCPYDCELSYNDCVNKVDLDVFNLITHLQTENDRLVKENENLAINNCYKWISTKDSLPEELNTVLALCKDGGMFVGYYTSWGHWQIWTARKSTKTVNRTVTHWMSLPALPKKGGITDGD